LQSNKSILEEIVENTLKSLRRAGFVVESIVYPENRRSIDIVGSYKGEKIIIKASLDSHKVSDIEVNDLKKASLAYNASPLIVARRHGRHDVEDDVVYSRKGVKVINDVTLENIVLKNDRPLVQNVKGTFLVRINPEKFRKRRLELGYSLGEIASLLGVTRKSVYEYERGNIAVRLEVAIRIAEIFGEDVFEPIDIFETPADIQAETGEKPRNLVEKLLYLLAMRKGYDLYRLFRTPIDYVLSRSRDRTLSIIYQGSSLREFRFKIEQAEKISRMLNTKPLVVKEPSDVKILEDYI